MLQEISLGLNVVFKGTFSRSETVRILGDIDVMVIPSTWYENSPLILLQSLATHTPCIVSNVEGMTEFVEEGTNGFHFTRGSEEDLYVKMQNFVSDRFLAQRLSLTTSYERTAFDMARDVDKMYSDYVS